MIAMIIIFSGANDKVKRSHYETFWYSHHFFVVWFLALILHGPVWKWWCLPALGPYVIDRLARVFYRGNKRMALARVYFWGKGDKVDVVTLQFVNAFNDKNQKPVTYMEGHYLYLCCPAVEAGFKLFQEWHPFTISSAPDEPMIEVNIRVNPSPYSWTNKVARYLKLLDPTGMGEVELATRNPTTGATTLGKVIGPDGKPFFRVDAPHGAPSQHVFKYDTAILVGAGIGVTPCASIMKGVVNYRWKKGFLPKNLHFFWVARLTELTTFKWLLVMLPELKAQQLTHNEYYGGDEQRRTALMRRAGQLKKEIAGGSIAGGSGGGLPPGWMEAKAADGKTYYHNAEGQTSWVHPGGGGGGGGGGAAGKQAELKQVQEQLKAVGENSRQLSITLYLTGAKKEDLQSTPNPKPGSVQELVQKLQETKDEATGTPYLTIKPGRPKWDEEFTDLAAVYGKTTIGVVFCGAPAIAAALKEATEKHSSSDATVFRLHKENF